MKRINISRQGIKVWQLENKRKSFRAKSKNKFFENIDKSNFTKIKIYHKFIGK